LLAFSLSGEGIWKKQTSERSMKNDIPLVIVADGNLEAALKRL
jgi:hypothetical protein